LRATLSRRLANGAGVLQVQVKQGESVWVRWLDANDQIIGASMVSLPPKQEPKT
jgi:hypothetical protein